MPPRVARSSTASAAPKSAKNKARKRNLDAYSTASHQIKERRVTAPHRLGESIDDNPRPKRRKTEDDDAEDDEDASDDEPRRKKPRGVGEEAADGVEEGSDSEGNEWTMGGMAEDDSDSDLDSDEAFGESDEEKFEGFTFRGSSAPKGKRVPKKKQRAVEDEEIDLDEADDMAEDEEDGDSFGEEGVDLATMLDDESEDLLGEEGEDEDSGSEDEDESLSEGDSEDADGADNEERVARLRDRVDAMDADLSTRSTAPDETGILSVDDLLADLDPAAKKQYAAILKTKRKSQAPKTLAAPLPKRQQDRLNREAATKKAKEQLDRWQNTVMHNRRAEFLTFPLVDPNRTDPIGKEKFDTQGAPQNELEANIQRIMEESGMASKPGEQPADDEDAIMKAEELGTNHLPLEEVMRRRAELRRTRELLFREEIKAKRVAKIKSRSYRRVHRKERERNAEKERALLDPAGKGLPMDEDEREEFDRKRAEERMGTKHRDSKWAKSLKATNRTVWDEGARGSVHEQARRQEELRRRIAGEEVDSGEDGSDVPSDSDHDGADAGEDARTLRQLAKLKGNGAGIGQKGVGGMKFMQAAEGRKRARNDEAIERLRKELAVMDGDEESESEIEDEGLGRAIFGPKAKGPAVMEKKVRKPELEEGDISEDEEIGGLAEESLSAVKQQPKPAGPKGILKKTSGASGPLAKGSARDRRTTEAVKEADGAAGGSWLTAPEAKKSKKDRQREREVGGDIVLDGPVKAEQTKPKPKGKKTEQVPAEPTPTDTASAKDTDGWTTIAHPNTTMPAAADDAEDSDVEPAENLMLTAAEQKTSYHHRAFAGDDVRAAFDAEKAAAAEEEGEHEVSTHLPGWGSWAGDGLSSAIRKSNARARHNPLFKSKLPGGVKVAERKDGKSGMEKVIVSEAHAAQGRGKKGEKYLVKVLPFGFERGEQYERAMRVPVGPEWVTKEVFQRGVRPRVVVKPGRVVGAMERPMM
ncbi:hypothetical protein LTR08_000773 [Meristemomyces frigidus]|nr:hypothetical protein LTR08_000773 [Meristemomyces frigidus]